MPSSAVRRFTDPDEYALAVRATAARMTAVAGGPFAATLVRIDLHNLWMQRFFDSSARVTHAVNVPGRAIIAFGTAAAAAPVTAGFALNGDTLVRFADGQTCFQHSTGPTAFAAMSLSIDTFEALSGALVGATLNVPADAEIVRPPADALARLRRLHAAASKLAKDNAAAIADPRTATALEQELMLSPMVACLAKGDVHGDSAASRHHSAIIRRFHEVLEASGEERLHIIDLCSRLHVSDRTLRACCQEHLGMSPHRYLWMRQMTVARRALLRANPVSTTVTDIATANGFWELARFAVGYRQLFGESPSASLRRLPRL